MIAAGIGALGVNGTAASFLIKKYTVVVGQPGKGKNLAFEVEMFDKTSFAQPFGNLLGRIPGLENIDQLHTHQILDGNFHGQTATDRPAVVAQIFSILYPGRRQIDMAV
jgi:hypothetical protein